MNKEDLKLIDKYFRLSNYLSVGQLYLKDNPLLKRELKLSDIKKKLVGHWGTVPGQNFIYAHLSYAIKKYDLNMIYISGPGHGGQAMIANSYIEGTYSEVYPDVTMDEKGLKKLFKEFSFPGGVPSHVAPSVPGSINEGGELGYSLAHAYGAILDNPSLIAACVIGDGEAETGPLATSWNINKFINPKTDGVVLPILHLNGYKIANPTIIGRMKKKELFSFFKGYGYRPYYIEGDDPIIMHQEMQYILKQVIRDIKTIKLKAKFVKQVDIKWPMIILKTKKGWTGPKYVENRKIEDSFKSHQIPFIIDADHKNNLKTLEYWMRSYVPEELFNFDGSIRQEIRDFTPKGNKRMSANIHANGGLLTKDLITPNIMDYAVRIVPGKTKKSDMFELGGYIRDLFTLNKENKNFRIFGPDEAMSNKLTKVFDVEKRTWIKKINSDDEYLAYNGRIFDSYLSEHVCEGALEGYILTGRFGFMHSYEAFIRIIDSMTSQHAKWLKLANELNWREKIPSLNYVLTSHIWQQDHNGFTHQDPGFLNHLATKKADTVRMYLPVDTNTLICTFDHVIKTKNYINVIVASKHESIQWFNMNDAIEHCKKGIGIMEFASSNEKNVDLVMACCGDVPTLEVIAAVKIFREFLPDLKIRVINVIDLMKLQSDKEHPHGLTDKEFDSLFTRTKPIVFAYHGYPNLIHELMYKRVNDNLHVHGYIEEGTITTPFDMRVRNRLDRFHLILNAIKYIPKKYDTKEIKTYCLNKLLEHDVYIKENGIDMEEIRDWKW